MSFNLLHFKLNENRYEYNWYCTEALHIMYAENKMFLAETINTAYVVVRSPLLYDCEVKDTEYSVWVCFSAGGRCLHWFGRDEFSNGCQSA